MADTAENTENTGVVVTPVTPTGGTAPTVIPDPVAGSVIDLNAAPAAGEGAPAASAAPAADLGYTDSGNATINAIQTIFKNSGVPADKTVAFFEKAMQSGKSEDVDVAGIKAALKAEDAEMVTVLVNGVLAEAKSKADAITNSFLTAVGGQEVWKDVQVWVNAEKQRSPEFAATIEKYNEMLAQGPEQAKLVGAALKGEYMSANITRKPNTIKGDSGAWSALAPIHDGGEFGKLAAEALSRGDIQEANTLIARYRSVNPVTPNELNIVRYK